MDVIACVLWIALILYIGFDTTAVYSYLRLLPSLNFLTHVRDYEKEQSERNWRMSYSLYMQLHHGGFLVNLVTCRYCLGVWLAIAASVVCAQPGIADNRIIAIWPRHKVVTSWMG